MRQISGELGFNSVFFQAGTRCLTPVPFRSRFALLPPAGGARKRVGSDLVTPGLVPAKIVPPRAMPANSSCPGLVTPENGRTVPVVGHPGKIPYLAREAVIASTVLYRFYKLY